MTKLSVVGLLVMFVLLPFGIDVYGADLRQDRKEELIRVRGSNAMARLADECGKAFSSANPGTTVVVAGGGTEAGFEALFERSADIAMASRKILDKELQAAALQNCNLASEEVCRTSLALITHPSNPVKELTLKQAAMILTGKIVSWKDVGGPDEPITLYVGHPVSGAAQFLRARLMENDFFGSESKVRDYYHHTIRDVARRQPSALSYAPYRDAINAQNSNQIKILGLKQDEKSPAMYPSLDTVVDKSYPLIMPLYFYWNAATAGSIVQRFVEFCKHQCGALAEQERPDPADNEKELSARRVMALSTCP